MSAVGLKAWFLLFRPWSYAATLVPFFVAAAFPSAAAPCWGRWWIGLACGLFFQASAPAWMQFLVPYALLRRYTTVL